MFRRSADAGLALAMLLTGLALLAPAHGHAETWFEAAGRHWEAGNLVEARRMLEREIRVRPQNLDARYDLAVLLERMGHANEAARLYEENLKKGWHLPTVVNLSAIYRGRGETAKAKALLQQAARRFRHEAAPWYLLADMAEARGDAKTAEADYRKAIRADPLNGYARIRHARFLARHGHPAQAASEAEQALRLAPECAPCLVIAGDIWKRQGRLRRALAAYQKAEAIAPRRDTRKRIIETLAALGMTRQADIMRRALAAEPANPTKAARP